MPNNDTIETHGEIIEILRGPVFKIKTDLDTIVLGHLAGKLRQNGITIMVGDKVRLVISPYDLTKGRITFRM